MTHIHTVAAWCQVVDLGKSTYGVEMCRCGHMRMVVIREPDTVGRWASTAHHRWLGSIMSRMTGVMMTDGVVNAVASLRLVIAS